MIITVLLVKPGLAFIERIGLYAEDRRWNLTFEPGATRAGVAFMRDRETDSFWQVLTGQAWGDELFGERLESLPSHYSFWFAWSDLHTPTELYGASG